MYASSPGHDSEKLRQRFNLDCQAIYLAHTTSQSINMHVATTKSSPFDRLPDELLTEIFKLIGIPDSNYSEIRYYHRTFYILTTCKRFYYVASPLFYGAFNFITFTSFRAFLKAYKNVLNNIKFLSLPVNITPQQFASIPWHALTKLSTLQVIHSSRVDIAHIQHTRLPIKNNLRRLEIFSNSITSASTWPLLLMASDSDYDDDSEDSNEDSLQASGQPDAAPCL